MSDDDATVFPESGLPPAEVLARITKMHEGDIDWRSGRAFSLVYNAADDAHEELIERVATMFQHENALNPLVYPSLMEMELGLVAMAAELFGTEPNAGSISSGGTESIFLAVQVARDHARQNRGIAEPKIISADTAHPAFAKAAWYLDIEQVRVPVRDDGRMDTDALADAVDDRTGLVVGSAPCYPYGVIDDIPAIAAVAERAGALCHVDACLGGWLLPWYEQIGEDVPPWDFRVPGVTSLSADVHKYGYTFKGLSTVTYRTRDLVKMQQFWYDDWPGGLYASGTTAGTRPAPPIAGAWAAIHHLGAEGYRAKATQVRDAGRIFMDGIDGIDRLEITHRPDIPVFEFTARDGSILAIADGMDRRGWHLDRQQGGLHLMLSPAHLAVADQFIADLRDAVAEAPVGGDGGELSGTYGGVV